MSDQSIYQFLKKQLSFPFSVSFLHLVFGRTFCFTSKDAQLHQEEKKHESRTQHTELFRTGRRL